MLRHVPNILTVLRLVLVPVFVALMTVQNDFSHRIAVLLFALAAFTDYLDGFIARRWGVTSKIGAVLDPVADKILVMSALVMLVAQRSELTGQPWVPGWMVVLILAREMWISGVRGVIAAQGRILPAGGKGKVKSLLQMLAIILLLVHEPQSVWGFSLSLEWIGLALLAASIAFSYLSAFDYTVAAFREKPRQ